MSAMPSDDVLVAAYAVAPVTADQVAMDSAARLLFCSYLPPEYREGLEEPIAKRLLSLRKQGKLRAKYRKRPR